MQRRDFFRILGTSIPFIYGLPAALGGQRADGQPRVPSYLQNYDARYLDAPRQAAIQWFSEAKFGLFIHYGLYSLLGRGEWVQYGDKIPIKEYARLKDKFTAENFDADFITDLALEAEMQYINLVTKHCDSFCLWDTQYTNFNSVNSPAGRDLVGEMADSCRKKGLGLFLFYEHGFDWRHPHGPHPKDWDHSAVRPHYDPPDPFYASKENYNFQNYLDYASGQIKELLTNYGPVAGIWLDGIAIPLSGNKSKFKVPHLYRMIRSLQKQALISYKWGLIGTEDFLAPEKTQVENLSEKVDKPIEVCWTLQEEVPPDAHNRWGYVEGAKHMDPSTVLEHLEWTANMDANLLLNTGPLPDGSIHPEDVKTLKAVGRDIRKNGWPG